MTWIQEHYYDLRTYFRNLFKSSTEEWLEAELMAVDEALGFTLHSSRFPGDRITRIGNMNEANSKLLSMWEKAQNKAESLSQDNLSLDEQLEQMKEREAELKTAWADDAKMYQEELKIREVAYNKLADRADDLYDRAAKLEEERDKLKLELRDEQKWSQEMARMADERGDKIGKLNDEIEILKNRRSELGNDKMHLVREVETYKDADNTLKRLLGGAQK